MSHPTREGQASAASSGASATDHFLEDKSIAFRTTPERVNTLATEVITAIHEVIRRHGVSYDEYNALKAWLISVGQDGEWPLFLDVWVEHVIEEVASASHRGSRGTIEGPYYVPGSPRLTEEATLPMRDDERGTPLLLRGRVTDLAGQALPGAEVEIWQADDDGLYSQFAPGIPEWNLRATVPCGDQGTFAIRTVQPAPYQIPTDGSCGKLIAAAGWHAWRPAHLHLKVSAPKHRAVTTQLYFAGGQHVEDDVASAVKPELIVSPVPAPGEEGREVTYDFALDRA